MKDDSGVMLIGAVAIIGVVAFVWWLSQALGVSMEVTTDFVERAVVVMVLYGLASWGASLVGWSNPWPFVFSALWWASWPVIIAKGTTTPEFLVIHGVEPAFVWWAATSFRWLILLATAGPAAWLYWKENSER